MKNMKKNKCKQDGAYASHIHGNFMSIEKPCKICPQSKKPFNALMCFASSDQQTPDDVFNMIQERMRTVVGIALNTIGDEYEKRLASCVSSGFPSVESLKDWHHGEILFSPKCFDEAAASLRLSTADVLGAPSISDTDWFAIQKAWTFQSRKDEAPLDYNGLDPAAIFVIFLTLDEIDNKVQERQKISARCSKRKQCR